MPTCTGLHARLYDDAPGQEPCVIDTNWAAGDPDQIVGDNLGRPLRDGETCAALIESMMAAGYTVTRSPRTDSPNGLAWPGVRPRWRPARPHPMCPACSTKDRPRRCRR